MSLGNFSISLAVKDIAVSVEFYEKLGFTHAGGDTGQGWAIMRNGEPVGDRTPCGQLAGAAPDHQVERCGAGQLTLDQLAFQRCGACGNRHEGCSHVSSVANRQWAG